MKASDVMQRELITAKVDTTLDDAVRLMVSYRVPIDPRPWDQPDRAVTHP